MKENRKFQNLIKYNNTQKNFWANLPSDKGHETLKRKLNIIVDFEVERWFWLRELRYVKWDEMWNVIIEMWNVIWEKRWIDKSSHPPSHKINLIPQEDNLRQVE